MLGTDHITVNKSLFKSSELKCLRKSYMQGVKEKTDPVWLPQTSLQRSNPELSLEKLALNF